MIKISKELIGASSVPLILSILEKEESYGYEIIKRVKELSKGKIKWSDGMLYPVLRKMEKQKLISSKWRMAENGRRRKYYFIEHNGREMLDTEMRNWKIFIQMFKELWKPQTRPT